MRTGNFGVSRRAVLPSALVLAIAVAACTLCFAMPPLVAYQPQLWAGVAGVAVGTAAALWRFGRLAFRAVVQLIGTGIIWAVALWCALSQQIEISQPTDAILAQRALPIALAAGGWAFLWLPGSWQKRSAIAMTLPAALSLVSLGWFLAPAIGNFQPTYLAIDSEHTLYVTDLDTPVIRVYRADGSLHAKLWPGLTLSQGAPGPVFSATGPLNDPDRLGLVKVKGLALPTPTWTPKKDPITFCGLATDGANQLYVPDPKHGLMLRFSSDGYLRAQWPLPEGYRAPAGGVVAAGDHVYLADDRGAVISLTPDGQTIETWPLPEPASSISISPDKTHIYVLSPTHLFAIDARSGSFTSSPLAAPSAGAAALATGSVVMGNRLSSRLDVYCPDGSLWGQVGGSGGWPGQVQQVEGLATNAGGQQLYVADAVNRVVNRFSADGHLTALHWSAEDEEQGEVKR